MVGMPAVVGIPAFKGNCCPEVSSQLEELKSWLLWKADPVHWEAVNFVSLREWMEATSGAVISTS